MSSFNLNEPTLVMGEAGRYKLRKPVPLCDTCKVGLWTDNPEYQKQLVGYHTKEGHEVRETDCLHPFMKELPRGLSCGCACRWCGEHHR